MSTPEFPDTSFKKPAAAGFLVLNNLPPSNIDTLYSDSTPAPMYEIRHLAGLAGYKANTNVSIEIEPHNRRLKFISWPQHIYINFEDITAFTFDEHYKRSAGKTAAGALVGGVLTGGIGLLAGAALGARRSGDHTLYIGYKVGQIEVQASFKGSRVGDFYGEVIKALSVPPADDWQREINPQMPKSVANQTSNSGCMLSISLLLAGAVFTLFIIFHE